MSEYKIITDSSCDLPVSKQQEWDLTVVPLALTLEGREYLNTTDERGVPHKDLYAKLRQGEMVTTSAANVGAFLEKMEPILQAGMDILYVGFSSALSGTYSAGVNAARELMEKYPGRRVLTVDSLCASLGQGLFLYHLVMKKRTGVALEALKDYAEKIKLNIVHWFTVDDLMFLKRGGRLSGAAAFIGSILNIKPVMHVDNEGRLVPVSKVRGRKASMRALAENICRCAKSIENQTVFISHGDCEEEARAVQALIEEQSDLRVSLVDFVGPVIGAHSGPGTLAVFVFGTER